MQAYINYLYSLNNAMASITIEFRLHDKGNNASPIAANGPIIAGPVWATWTYNTSGIGAPVYSPPGNSSPPGFFANFPMQVNHWYMVHTGIFLGDEQHFFPSDCDVSEFVFRVQVPNAMTSDGPVLELSGGEKTIRTFPIY
jgi:hypothetical protein